MIRDKKDKIQKANKQQVKQIQTDVHLYLNETSVQIQVMLFSDIFIKI